MHIQLNYDHLGLRSNEPLTVKVVPDPEIRDYWFATIDDPFWVVGVGHSQQDAIDELAENIYTDFHAYAEEDDALLDSRARELARYYRSTFERTKPDGT